MVQAALGEVLPVAVMFDWGPALPSFCLSEVLGRQACGAIMGAAALCEGLRDSLKRRVWETHELAEQEPDPNEKG